MPLTYVDKNIQPEFVAVKTLDQNENVVILHISHEVIQDHGFEAGVRAGSIKYDRGSIIANNPPIVKVYTDDI